MGPLDHFVLRVPAGLPPGTCDLTSDSQQVKTDLSPKPDNGTFSQEKKSDQWEVTHELCQGPLNVPVLAEISQEAL